MIGLLMNKSQYYTEKYFFSSRLSSVPKNFSYSVKNNRFYSRNFTFITQEITNTLLNKFECSYLSRTQSRSMQLAVGRLWNLFSGYPS